MDVKGKIKVCQTALADFNVEQINGSPFFCRYSEFVRLIHKYLPNIDPEQLLAQPIESHQPGILEWYVPITGEDPAPLSSLSASEPEEYARYSALRTQQIAQLKQVASQVTLPQERLFMDCLLRYLDTDYADDVAFCHDGVLTFAVWGMKMRRGRDLATVITDAVREHRVHTVRYVVSGHGHIEGRTEMLRKHGHALQGAHDIPEVTPDVHYTFSRWEPCAPQGKRVDADVTYTAVCERTDPYEVRFQARQGGTVGGAAEQVVTKRPGEALLSTDLPMVSPEAGWKFVGWVPAFEAGVPVNDDLYFEADFQAIEVEQPIVPPPPPPPLVHKVRFVTGENGFVKGTTNTLCEFDVKHGESLDPTRIPLIKPNKGFAFREWDAPITSGPITSDVTYTALYDKKEPWWRRLKWLWWLLGLLLALLLLLFLLKNCKGCTSCSHHREVNGVVETDSTESPDGRGIDDNGEVRPIEIDDDGRLPDDANITAPVTGDEDGETPIVEQPGMPSVIGNRLFLFLENDNDNVDALARDFKKAYPDESKYSIIGYDRDVKMLVVKVPANERDQLRKTMNQRIANHKFLVFDEQIYEIHSSMPGNSPNDQPADYGWHLRAIHAQQAWSVTKGSPSVKVAVVDDGIQASHPMFAGRITEAYNVYTQNNHLSLGEGHGTHTAALAAGSQANLAKGASGVAPMCKIMPVQVFDNKQCPLSALIAGIMYAIHHDADVINVSIGPSFPGLSQLPEEQQAKLLGQFQNMEALWERVCQIADKKHTLIVFAAGNDHILALIPPENRNVMSLAVGAVDKQIQPSDFTNYGGYCDVSAPGTNILSAFPQSTLRSLDGTSMAAPIVTGTLALMKSIKKDITLAQARNVLQRTGQQVNGSLPPMILADQALAAVKRGDFSAPTGNIVPGLSGRDGGAQAGIAVPGGGSGGQRGGGIAVPVGSRPTQPGVQPQPATDDYEAIRRMIREYEQKIKELKRRLPRG